MLLNDIKGRCIRIYGGGQQQSLLVVVIWLFILHKVGGEPEALCNDLILKLNTVWLYRFMHPKQT
ncbi:hypothetical protein BAY46_25975 [Klebsiella pneumoniae]|nr:hypothetical protein KPNIH27_27470 [Klebsiella pneumoniae subsp. pneumoniae KPNIH27]AIW74082.1 hypothetical protein KPNIH33_28130 [Klebsiella pneumoniae subsp. pneumoniae]AKL27103.1 hypothetical protein AB186_02135 [Klebsiella pneumoniae]EPF41684.1 hypothetical protein F869_20659 [Klebsiella pneumoniae subsp. pneumoniae CIP 52.145 = B5055]OCN22552.1 hypothetical protein AN701_0213715 [Serratia marcescens]